MNLLVITKKLSQVPPGGRELLSELHYLCLQKLFGSNVQRLELSKGESKRFLDHFCSLLGLIDGLSGSAVDEIIKLVKLNNIDKVLLDGSNFGLLAKVLKSKVKNIKVITFYHNVEARFFLGALREKKTFRALAILIANVIAERQATRYSDHIVCLSERDSRVLKRLYGRPATHIAPMVVEDKRVGLNTNCVPTSTPPYMLFVGGDFYANRSGITWFVRNVMPYVDLPLVIVGRGFERYRSQLAIPGKVNVVGVVDSLSEWYAGSHFVVAPIFDGSGMKTKVAEALMFGKRVIGTPEAFSGYEKFATEIGYVCHDSHEFVAAINNAKLEFFKGYDTRVRALYERQYSMSAAEKNLWEVLA